MTISHLKDILRRIPAGELQKALGAAIKEDVNEKEIIPFNLGLVLNRQGIASMPMQHNDLVRIYNLDEIEGSTKYVSISGNVKKPGRYELYENNMHINDLLFHVLLLQFHFFIQFV